MKTTNEAIAAQVSRIASDMESEKRTRAETNKFIIDAVERIRADVNAHFNGTDKSPGILIRLDRIEQKNFEGLKNELELHEDRDNKRFEKLEIYITESKSFVRALFVIGGIVVTIIQVLIAIFL